MDGDIAAWDAHWQSLVGGAKSMVNTGVHRQYFGLLRQHIGHIHGIDTLELGAGRGTVSQLLASNGATVTLLDTSKTALQIAKDNFRKAFVGCSTRIGDARDTGLTDKSYDAVFSVGLLEHFDNPGPVLLESERLARDVAWHLVIGRDSSNDKWYRNDLTPAWYEEQGWRVGGTDKPNIFWVMKRCSGA